MVCNISTLLGWLDVRSMPGKSFVMSEARAELKAAMRPPSGAQKNPAIGNCERTVSCPLFTSNRCSAPPGCDGPDRDVSVPVFSCAIYATLAPSGDQLKLTGPLIGESLRMIL